MPNNTQEKEVIVSSSATSSPVSTDQILKAMDIYLKEYIHRDTHMWSQNFKFFFSSLIVMLLPNLVDHFNIAIPAPFSNINWFFPVLGIILAFLFIYNAISLTKRFKAVSSTYMNLALYQLPAQIRLISINKKQSKKLASIHTYMLPTIMFLGLITLAILLLVTK